MGKPYSMDLRERVVAAVDPGGPSCHRAAAQFGVGVNTAILWVRRFRETGSVAPGAARTVEAVWDAIGQLLPAFIPKECANYFENAGYAST